MKAANMRRLFVLSFRLLSCLLLAILLAACGASRPATPPVTPPSREGHVADLDRFPQDLRVYAMKAGADRQLLPFTEQAAQDARWNRRFFAPWRMTRISVPVKDVAAPFGTDGRPRGYAENLLPWDVTRWGALASGAALDLYPSQAWKGIVVSNSALREVPTLRPMFTAPTRAGQGYPFDMFQRTAVWMGTPVFVGHATADRAWLYVETAFAAGWMPAADVARVDDAFMTRYESGSLAAILRDDTSLNGADGTHLATAHIGTVLPLSGASQVGRTVLVPVRAPEGHAVVVPVLLTSGEAAQKPVPLTPGNMAELGNRMMGQPYGWGGLYEDRDCSSTLRDLFTPFGLWLPRNSASQAKAGRYVDIAKLDADDKESRIVAEGVPFMTLLWLRGHITLYLGLHEGQAAMFHNMWGIRTHRGGVEGRYVLGRAVVTSTRPGLDVPGNDNADGLLGRMQGMSILPGGAQ